MTPQRATFYASSPYGYPNIQNAFVPQYGNTPTGGSFGASPAAWFFNIPSPNTGTAANNNNYQSPFAQMPTFAENKGIEQSPKFNSVTDWKTNLVHNPSGMDSTRQYNASMNPNFNKMQHNNQNYVMSPANAFSFSCKSGKYPSSEVFTTKI